MTVTQCIKKIIAPVGTEDQEYRDSISDLRFRSTDFLELMA